MTPKQLWYSGHARGRLKRRGITRQEVRWMLAKGIATDLGDNVYERRGYLGKYEAAVIYHENAARYLIITVEWIGDDD